MQPLPELGRFPLYVDREVGQSSRYVLFKEARFDSAGRFQHFLPIPFFGKPKYL
jgi:hypothetical protein